MTMTNYRQFLELDIAPAAPAAARYHIIPVPFEASVSYGGGTAAGPAALLEASLQLEAFDGVDIPASAGIYTQAPVDCQQRDVTDVLAELAARVSAAAAAEQIPVVLGGEHTVTLGAVQGMLAAGKKVGVVQFDAHADLRDSYEDNKYSHACVMRRLLDLDVPIVQLAVRSLSQDEAKLRRKQQIPHWDAARLVFDGIPDPVLPEDFPEQIYITFDVDAFDPAVMPGTGTPEPGGLNWYDALMLLENICQERKVIGFDVVELAPIPGSHISEFTAAKLVYSIMAMINSGGSKEQ